MELPGRHTCSGLGSLTRVSILGGENIQMAESPRMLSWRERGTGNMDGIPFGRSTMDQREEFYRSSRIKKTNEARLSHGRDQQSTAVNECFPSIMSMINLVLNFIRGKYLL